MPSDLTPGSGPDERDIEKMLEESRMKPVPADVLKGFKDDVMRRIEAEKAAARPRSGRWFASGWKLPVGLSAGAGALACLLVVALAVLTTDRSAPPAGSFQTASAPALMNAPIRAMNQSAVLPAQEGAQADAARAQASGAFVRKPASAQAAPLTVEEELRLIEEFDDRRFFIRQDITDDDLASA